MSIMKKLSKKILEETFGGAFDTDSVRSEDSSETSESIESPNESIGSPNESIGSPNESTLGSDSFILDEGTESTESKVIRKVRYRRNELRIKNFKGHEFDQNIITENIKEYLVQNNIEVPKNMKSLCTGLSRICSYALNSNEDGFMRLLETLADIADRSIFTERKFKYGKDKKRVGNFIKSVMREQGLQMTGEPLLQYKGMDTFRNGTNLMRALRVPMTPERAVHLGKLIPPNSLAFLILTEKVDGETESHMVSVTKKIDKTAKEYFFAYNPNARALTWMIKADEFKSVILHSMEGLNAYDIELEVLAKPEEVDRVKQYAIRALRQGDFTLEEKIFAAATSGLSTYIREDLKGYSFNITNHRGYTPLAYAARYGSAEGIRSMFRHTNADANILIKDGYLTAFHIAAVSGRKKTVETFLEFDEVELTTKNCKGESPLDYAKGNPRIFSLIHQGIKKRNLYQRVLSVLTGDGLFKGWRIAYELAGTEETIATQVAMDITEKHYPQKPIAAQTEYKMLQRGELTPLKHLRTLISL